MFGYFYHSRTRKAVALFGSLFNDINVMNRDASGGVINQIRVPISYAPRTKFIERLRENPDLQANTKVALKLPRMSFEIVSLSYNPEKQLTRQNVLQSVSEDGGTLVRAKIRQGVPYLLSFQLNVYTERQDDALQIIEQVMPYFSPHYTVTIDPFPQHPIIQEDIPITLNSVAIGDDFEGEVGQRRVIQYVLDFEMPLNFYGPIDDVDIIRTAIADIGLIEDSDGAEQNTIIETMIIEPDPLNVSFDSDFGFTETIIPATDSQIFTTDFSADFS